MKTHKDSFTKLRGNTDKSLGEERIKSDEYIGKKAQALTHDAEDSIRVNRAAADESKNQSRNKADSAKANARINIPSTAASRADDKSLTLERERSDKAQDAERTVEDNVRANERFKKRLVAAALLSTERKVTDDNLLDERVRIDLDSAEISHLLSDERISHDLTRSALVTRDQFLAVVSHDLRNPLGSITMSASMMRSELSTGSVDADTLSVYLDMIERNAASMDRMINDLLDVERMAQGKLVIEAKSQDIDTLLNEGIILFSKMVEAKSISLKIQAMPEPMFVNVDHDRVLQVLSNLIGNALKFTPNGGSISLSAQQKANEIEVSVTDTGAGISENKRSNLFDRFSQLGSNDRRGLGLGLFISKWIVEAHKGRIWVDSEIGKGSTFTFTLPITG